MKVGISTHFEKRLKKLSAQERIILDERTDWFVADKSDPRLKVHALAGRLKGYFSFSISYKKRVKFKFVSDEEVIFVDVGLHEEVYR